MEAPSYFRRKLPGILLGTVILLGLFAARLHNYLLYHSLTEIFSVVVACSIFLVAWNARRSQENQYFQFVGIGYLFSGVVDLVHMLGYKGMGVFPGYDSNLPTQLWICARYIQAITLLIAPRFADRPLNFGSALAGFAVAASLSIASVFAGVFPDCYIEGAGLTPFKIYSEYAICVILFASILHLRARRALFDGDVFRMLVVSIAVAIGSEFLFTLYRYVYGYFNFLGHFLKILSFFFIYRAAIGIDFSRRLELNRLLQQELADRKRAEENARHLATFPQWNPNPVIEVDASGNVVFCNPATLRILENLGMNDTDVRVFLPEDMDGIFRDLDKNFESSLYREITINDRVFGETVFPVPQFHTVRLYVFDITEIKRAEAEVRTANEGLEKRVAVRTWELRTLTERLQDELAERRRAEDNLRQSEARFRALVERSPVGIFIVQGGRIVYRNPEQARLFGPMPEEFELRAFRDVHPEDAARFGELVDSISAGGDQGRGMDLRFYPYGKLAEGADLRWVQVNTIPMEYGGEAAVLVSMADITRLKEMEYQFLVREKMASLGHVAAGIAHEIRNPLSGINIHLSALERIHEEGDGLGADGRDQAGKVVRQIQSASERIESVVRKVLDFSRPNAVRTDPADVSLAIENAIDFTATQLRKERITLDRSGLRALPKCRVDPPLITQVVMNLIVNAAQALENSEGPKVIAISSFTEGGHVVVCVSDSGPGISPAIRDRIFDPFFTTRKDGHGIGLSFCRRVISEHGGILKVDVGRLGGAEFRIELPLVPAGKTVSVGTP